LNKTGYSLLAFLYFISGIFIAILSDYDLIAFLCVTIGYYFLYKYKKAVKIEKSENEP